MSTPGRFIDLYNQLSRTPSGLLRWFGIPSGSNPNNVAGYYQPTLDLWEHLTQSPENQQLFLSAVVNVAAGALGSQIIQLVTDFVWVPPQGLTFRTTPLAAGVAFDFTPACQFDLTTGVECAIGGRASTRGGTALANEFVVGTVQNGFFMGGRGPSQTALSAMVTQNTAAAPVGVQISMRYVNLSRPGQPFV